MLTHEEIQALDLKQATRYLKQLDKDYNLDRPITQQPRDIMLLVDAISTQVAWLDDHIRQLNFPSNQ